MTNKLDKGLGILRKVNPEAAQSIIDNFSDISPDMCRFIFEFSVADIYNRSTLDEKTKELIAIASLTTRGIGEKQLAHHIEGALRSGCSREEILETIIQTIVFSGFPTAMNALMVAKDTLNNRGDFNKQTT